FPAERVLEFAKLVDEACVRVCEGQFLDISFETRTDVTTERYRAMAAKKTGALFAAAAQGAALLATEDAAVRETLARFGDAFGQAFQAHDDLLGVWGSTERTGKVEMNDLTKRKKTLPVVLGFERAQGKTRERLAALFAPAAPLSSESVEQIREILDELGVRALIDAEIDAQRGRALHALRERRDAHSGDGSSDHSGERDPLAGDAGVVGDKHLVLARHQVDESDVAAPIGESRCDDRVGLGIAHLDEDLVERDPRIG